MCYTPYKFVRFGTYLEGIRFMTQTIGIVVGSLRAESFSKKVANYVAGELRKKFDVKFFEIGDLPLYNEDLDHDNPPAPWVRLRDEVKNADAFVFVTPEYNRSVPAAIKNALDVASRPYGANNWSGKPGAVISVSPGALAGFGANHHLRQVATFLNIAMMQQPEAYIGGIYTGVDATTVTDPKVQEFLGQVVEAFEAWIARLS